jgi:hypothetical protein
MITLRAFVALLVSALFAPLFAADAPEREALEKAIPYGISLLEAKNYKAFLEAFVKPDDLKQITKAQPMDEFAAEFGKEAAADVLTVLKKIKDLKPKLDEKGTTATYTLPEAVKGETEFKFLKVDKYWYIAE